jgi:hypothetical protein
MCRFFLTTLIIPLCLAASVAQVQVVDGYWLEGGIDATSRVLTSFGPTQDVRYMGITFRDSLVLPGGVTLRSRGRTDVAIVVVDRRWDLVGYDHVGGPGHDSIVALTTLGNGDGAATIAACGGVLTPTVCRAGGITFSGRGGYDVVTMCWQPDGRPRWSRLDGGADADLPSAVTADPDGGLHITGTYVGSTRMGTFTRSDAAATSAFITRITPQGTVEWLTSTVSSDDDPDVPRGYAAGGSFCVVHDNTVVTIVGAAGTVGISGTLTRDVNTNYETYPYVMTLDRATGVATDWRRLDLCRGDSVTAAAVGPLLVSTVIEPRFCQPGTEPALRILLGNTRLSYVPGGLQSNVVATATTADGSLVLGGRFERSILFDSMSRRPDIISSSSTLQDGWIAVLLPDGRLRSALALKATTWAQVTSVSTRSNAMLVAGVAQDVLNVIPTPIGRMGTTGCFVMVATDPTASVLPDVGVEHPTDRLEGIWTLDGRFAGTITIDLPPGIYAGRRVNGAPFPILVGMGQR